MSLKASQRNRFQLNSSLHTLAVSHNIRGLHDFAATQGGINAEERAAIQGILSSPRRNARENHKMHNSKNDS